MTDRAAADRSAMPHLPDRFASYRRYTEPSGCWPMATIVVACWAVHRLLHQQPLSRLPRSVAIPSFLFVIVTIFSMVWGRAELDPRVFVPPTFYRVQLAAVALTAISIGLLFVGSDLF